MADDEMNERDVIAAQFDAEVALAARPPGDKGVRALGVFVEEFATLSKAEQRATIFWLADRFLGLRPSEIQCFSVIELQRRYRLTYGQACQLQADLRNTLPADAEVSGAG